MWGMKDAPEPTPVLLPVDAVLADLAVRSAMYAARRREDGDAGTFVIQTGEEGRLRLGLPDLGSAHTGPSAASRAMAPIRRPGG
jgi:hypothetical protein